MQTDVNFCQRCGQPLSERTIERTSRPYCESCGYTVFLDPKVAAVILVTKGDNLVLVRRGIEPAIGRWSFPSGFVNRGEVVEHAAKREVKEETGLDVKLDGLVGVYSSEGGPVMLAVYAATAIGGTPHAGHDATEVGLFPPDGLPDLPFPHDKLILDDWRTIVQRHGCSKSGDVIW